MTQWSFAGLANSTMSIIRIRHARRTVEPASLWESMSWNAMSDLAMKSISPKAHRIEVVEVGNLLGGTHGCDPFSRST